MENKYSSSFGFTEEEVKELLKDFDLKENVEEVKKWYDGYKIGKKEGIYNPWSILNFAEHKELRPYWVNTSSNDIIKTVVRNSKAVKSKILSMLNDEEAEVTVNLLTILKGIEKNENNAWGLFISSGYLKVVEKVDITEGIYMVKIPNLEIKHLFSDIIKSWFTECEYGEELKSMLNDLETLNFESYKEKFENYVLDMFSYFDVGENAAENFYHAFVLRNACKFKR